VFWYYFLLGEWQKYEDLDFDQSLLAKAYQLANKQVKERVSKQAGTAGRVEFIKVLTTDKQDLDVEKMIDQDWNALLQILGANPNRKEIWRFLYNAPVVWSKKLLDSLDQFSYEKFPQDERITISTLSSLSQEANENDLFFISGLLLNKVKHKRILNHKGSLTSLAISPDGSILVSGGHDKTISLWSLPDGNHLKTLSLNDSKVTSLAISPNSRTLVSSIWGRNIDLWSLPDGNHIKTLPSHNDVVHSLAISPDGNILATSSADKTIAT
jgi:WD40 repeat protein